MPRNFEKLRRSIPSIHVSDKHGTPSTLFPQPGDDYRTLLYFQDDYVTGQGFQHAPYRLRNACVESPHRVIVGMWFELQKTLKGESRKEGIFIAIGDWFLQVTCDGVIASDGQLTKFV